MELAGTASVLIRFAQRAPSITVTQQIGRRSIAQTRHQCQGFYIQTPRYFTTTSSILQQSAAARKPEDAEEAPQSREPDQRITMAPQHQREARPSQGKRRDGLGFMRNASDARASAQQSSTSPATSPLIQTDRNTLDTLVDDPAFDYLNQNKRSRRLEPSKPSDQSSGDSGLSSIAAILANLGESTASSSPRSGKFDTSRMVLPGQPARPASYDFPEVKVRVKVNDTAPPTFRISPSLGRTVAVDDSRSVDVARAFRMVDMKCSANSVKADLHKQRFHERPGLKRKRLVMSRWRKRFKEAFKATVRRVEDMRRKGW